MRKYLARVAALCVVAAVAVGMMSVSASAYHVPKHKCVVPILVGKTVSQAKSALQKNHCELGTVKKKKQKGKHKVKVGQIFKNSPAAGTQHKVGKKVNVTVRK